MLVVAAAARQDAEAFRAGRTLAGYTKQTATIREQQRAPLGSVDSHANAVGRPGDRSIAQRLDTIARVLFALARAQGVDPDTL
ncbi:hypothetical protein JK359_33225 [Streptomyces actinomycinicus]|uniref:Uncharacterized protein n=1 Tax=Streptomyces actinomycinicus TaxID=1695166 RepID=A0A937JQJ7_9ACTN|nr:hypothetical protein [Streptomyces actinomycinicus]MBL1086770.1 hypothetical protein [Streptomyces actinomycinicus]